MSNKIKVDLHEIFDSAWRTTCHEREVCEDLEWRTMWS